MNEQKANAKTISRLMMRLLPIQILFCAVGAVNGIVSSYFASNYVGVDAMSAVGLYGPVTMLISALSTILVGGSSFLCGKYMGQNEQEKVECVFSLDVILSVILSLIIAIGLFILATFDLTTFLTKDAVVRPILNQYFLGQAIGVLPLILGNQLTVFLSIENRQKRSVIASVSFIIVNLILNVLFVMSMHMEAFGLALASSLGLWVFCLMEMSYFVSGKSYIKFSLKSVDPKESAGIVKIGFPSAESYIYQTVRGLIVNNLLTAYIGSIGVSAFATANNLLTLFWAIPGGMIAVSRLLISVAIGEEDRQTLTDVIRSMFRRYIPLMMVVSAFLIIMAKPLAGIFYRDPSAPVYMLTVWGFRILPLCMPLSIICMHFVCYVHAVEKHVLLHTLTILDGVICVAGFTALLIGKIGMNSVYIANVLNGVVTTLVICIYPLIVNKSWPKTLEEFMAIPKKFGVPKDARMDISIKDMKDVTTVAEKVQLFCKDRGIDGKRAYLAGLSMEEMAGNVVDHGFRKDNKDHTVDVRVVHKDDDIILRIKDDCVPFDPHERQFIAENDDITKNIGIRMIFKMAEDIQYQNILGLNVLTIKV